MHPLEVQHIIIMHSKWVILLTFSAHLARVQVSLLVYPRQVLQHIHWSLIMHIVLWYYFWLGTFSDALDVLDTFNDFFLSKTLQKGTTVLLMWRPNPDAEVLDICILPPGSDESYGEAQAQLSISSSPLCRALFEVTSKVLVQVKTTPTRERCFVLYFI